MKPDPYLQVTVFRKEIDDLTSLLKQTCTKIRSSYYAARYFELNKLRGKEQAVRRKITAAQKKLGVARQKIFKSTRHLIYAGYREDT